MYLKATRKTGFLRIKWIVFGLSFLFCLIFLVAGSSPALENISGVQARFTGVQTTALATQAGECAMDDDGNGSDYFTYTFTGSRGVVYHITDSSMCSSGVVSDGDHVTIWYRPDDPTHFLTESDWSFDWIFFAGFSIPMVCWLVLCVIVLVRSLLVGRRSDHYSGLYSKG